MTTPQNPVPSEAGASAVVGKEEPGNSRPPAPLVPSVPHGAFEQFDEQGRPEPGFAADEAGTLLGFFLHSVIAPLRDAGLPDDAPFHAICEKGAVWFPFSAAVPSGDLQFTDRTKLAMVSLEKTVGADQTEYERVLDDVAAGGRVPAAVGGARPAALTRPDAPPGGRPSPGLDLDR